MMDVIIRKVRYRQGAYILWEVSVINELGVSSLQSKADYSSERINYNSPNENLMYTLTRFCELIARRDC